MKKTAIIIMVLVVVTACGTKKSDFFKAINKAEKEHIRGVEIGADLKTVKAVEDNAFLIDDQPQYLHYDYDISMGNSYTVTYDFYEKKLYEIEIAVYFDLVEDAKKVAQEFTEYYNDSYGKNKLEQDGFTTWKTTSSITKKPVEVALKEDSERNGYGYFVIKIYELEE